MAVRAGLDQGDASADELATALRRYEELDADEKALARRRLKRSDDGGIDLLEARDCNSPCKDYYEIADDIRETDAIDGSDATMMRIVLCPVPLNQAFSSRANRACRRGNHPGLARSIVT